MKIAFVLHSSVKKKWKHQQRSWFISLKRRKGQAEFPVCISVYNSCWIYEHRALSRLCVCPQITLWGRIHVLGNSVPLFRKNPQLAVCFVALCALQAKQGWMKFCGVEVCLMARLTCLFIYLFIFLISLLATGVVTGHCYGLSRGNIKVFVDSAGGFWSKLIGFFSRAVHVCFSSPRSVARHVSSVHLFKYLCIHPSLCPSIFSLLHLYTLHTSPSHVLFSLSICLSLF